MTVLGPAAARAAFRPGPSETVTKPLVGKRGGTSIDVMSQNSTSLVSRRPRTTGVPAFVTLSFN